METSSRDDFIIAIRSAFLKKGTQQRFSLIVLIGGFIGSSYGSKIAPQSTIKKILVVVLLFAAAKRIIELI